MADLSHVRKSDYREIAEFLTVFPGGEGNLDFWLRRISLWWDNNPSFAPDVPRGWVLRDQAGQIVGFLGSISSTFRAAGKDVRVVNATTWRVRPEHRARSFSLYLMYIEAVKAGLKFSTTPDALGVKILVHMGFKSLPSSRSGRMYLLPIRAAATARAWLRGRKVPSLICTPAGVLLQLAATPLVVRLRMHRSAAVKVVPSAGEAFDSLWERTRDIYTYTSVRNSAQIRWLCSGPFPRTLLGYEEEGKLRGYALFGDASWRGLRVLELLDLWSDWKDYGVIRALIAEGYSHAKTNDYDLLVLHDFSSELSTTYRDLGIVFTHVNPRRHFFNLGDTGLSPFTPENTYFSAIEGDLAV